MGIYVLILFFFVIFFLYFPNSKTIVLAVTYCPGVSGCPSCPSSYKVGSTCYYSLDTQHCYGSYTGDICGGWDTIYCGYAYYCTLTADVCNFNPLNLSVCRDTGCGRDVIYCDQTLECYSQVCGGTTYYCTNDGNTFGWRTSSNPDRCGNKLDDWYGGGDLGLGCYQMDDPPSELRDYYCVSLGQCNYNVINTTDCDNLDNWYGGGDLGPGCNQIDDPPSNQTDYYVSPNTNICTSTQVNCPSVDCDNQDGWEGGGNVPGCGDDPSSQLIDYYVRANSNTCESTTLYCPIFDCDSSDRCSNYCYSNVVYSYIDYYVVPNTNTCTFELGSVVENCNTKQSVDSDNSCYAYTTGGYVIDYTGCNNGDSSCTLYNIYRDSCSGSTLTEYCASGSSYTYTTKNCNDYDGCSGGPPYSYYDYYCYDTIDDYCDYDVYDPDSSLSYCSGCGKTWFSSTSDGNNRPCCGDDGSPDLFEASGIGNSACVQGEVVSHNNVSSINASYLTFNGELYFCKQAGGSGSGYSFVQNVNPGSAIGSWKCEADGLWRGGGVIKIRGGRIRIV